MSDTYADKLQQALISEYPDVFREKLPDTLKPILPGDVTHFIQLKDLLLEKGMQGYFPIPHAFMEGAKRVTFEHINAGQLVPSQSPVAAPVFYKAKKAPPGVDPKTINLRMLCDYRSHNANMI